jgi:hypothetical protein
MVERHIISPSAGRMRPKTSESGIFSTRLCGRGHHAVSPHFLLDTDISKSLRVGTHRGRRAVFCEDCLWPHLIRYVRVLSKRLRSSSSVGQETSIPDMILRVRATTSMGQIWRSIDRQPSCGATASRVPPRRCHGPATLAFAVRTWKSPGRAGQVAGERLGGGVEAAAKLNVGEQLN